MRLRFTFTPRCRSLPVIVTRVCCYVYPVVTLRLLFTLRYALPRYVAITFGFYVALRYRCVYLYYDYVVTLLFYRLRFCYVALRSPFTVTLRIPTLRCAVVYIARCRLVGYVTLRLRLRLHVYDFTVYTFTLRSFYPHTRIYIYHVGCGYTLPVGLRLVVVVVDSPRYHVLRCILHALLLPHTTLRLHYVWLRYVYRFGCVAIYMPDLRLHWLRSVVHVYGCNFTFAPFPLRLRLLYVTDFTTGFAHTLRLPRCHYVHVRYVALHFGYVDCYVAFTLRLVTWLITLLPF